MPLTDDDIDRALEWLVKNADKASQARAEREYLKEWLPSLKAQLAVKAMETGQSATGAELIAKAHPDYIEALAGYKEAVEADERMRWLQSTAQARIEAWRTMSSNNRAQGKIG